MIDNDNIFWVNKINKTTRFYKNDLKIKLEMKLLIELANNDNNWLREIKVVSLECNWIEINNERHKCD